MFRGDTELPLVNQVGIVVFCTTQITISNAHPEAQSFQ